MYCKNCQTNITGVSKFCNSCGAKVVTERITVKSLISDVSQNIFGWDNKFFSSIKNLVLNPGIMLREYLDGTRKKYINPFTFLVICMAINLFFFNTYEDDFVRINQDSIEKQVDIMVPMMKSKMGDNFNTVEFKEQQLAFSEKTTRIILKYFNLFTLLMLPLYAFFAYLIYSKPYNYGEHLVVTTYIQGFSFLTGTFIFLISILTYPSVYSLTLPLLVFYYTYTYGKLYKLPVWKSILKAFIFIGITILVSIILGILLYFVGYAFGKLITIFS